MTAKSQACLAGGCGQNSGDVYLCKECVRAVRGALHAIPSLVGELDVTLSRQHRFGASAGVTARLAEKPLPYHPKASAVAAQLKSELDVWSYELAELHGGDQPPRESVDRLASWMLSQTNTITKHPAAGQLCDGLLRVVTAAQRVVDRPVETWYAGPCDCGEDLYARANKGVVRCSACRNEYDIETRREELLAALEDQLVTTTELCRALSMLGRELHAETIRQWVARGKLDAKPPHPADVKERPRYRVGDVVDLMQPDSKKSSF